MLFKKSQLYLIIVTQAGTREDRFIIIAKSDSHAIKLAKKNYFPGADIFDITIRAIPLHDKYFISSRDLRTGRYRK